MPSLTSRRPPPASTYSGYGEYGGQFFYYGNMSKYAYENRFKYTRASNAGNTGEEFEEETNGPPYFDLIIGIQLRQFNKNFIKIIIIDKTFPIPSCEEFVWKSSCLSLNCSCPEARKLLFSGSWERKISWASISQDKISEIETDAIKTI